MGTRVFWAITEPLVGVGVGLFICWHVAKGATNHARALLTQALT